MIPQIARPSVENRLIPQLGFYAEWTLAILQRNGIADAVMSTLKIHVCCGPAANGNIAVGGFPVKSLWQQAVVFEKALAGPPSATTDNQS